MYGNSKQILRENQIRLNTQRDQKKPSAFRPCDQNEVGKSRQH